MELVRNHVGCNSDTVDSRSSDGLGKCISMHQSASNENITALYEIEFYMTLLSIECNEMQ